jgi:hypothetical protein
MFRSSSRALVALQVALPALLYLASGWYNGDVGISYLVPNYLFMAWPHLLLVGLAMKFKTIRCSIQDALVLLNVTLLLFIAWLLSSVPQREQGLAWVVYVPVAGGALLLVCGVAFFRRNRGARNET